MTNEMKNMIVEDLKKAEASGDIRSMLNCLISATIAMVDCQCKTAIRVKEITAKLEEQENVSKGKQLGIKFALEVLKIIGTVGGVTGAMKVLQVVNQ